MTSQRWRYGRLLVNTTSYSVLFCLWQGRQHPSAENYDAADNDQLCDLYVYLFVLYI